MLFNVLSPDKAIRLLIGVLCTNPRHSATLTGYLLPQPEVDPGSCHCTGVAPLKTSCCGFLFFFTKKDVQC